MRLADLNPKLAGDYLTFDCPYPGHTHKQRVRVSRTLSAWVNDHPEPTWHMGGEFPDSLTLSPSINADTPEHPCWHGFITNGDVT